MCMYQGRLQLLLDQDRLDTTVLAHRVGRRPL